MSASYARRVGGGRWKVLAACDPLLGDAADGGDGHRVEASLLQQQHAIGDSAHRCDVARYDDRRGACVQPLGTDHFVELGATRQV
ncbi:MAG: hypothetical protein H0W68_04285, partial [Gemmatimonadaceae bacterium]|nr:hypothetical protein [Gemmatimonadaceae bacterium]